MNRAVVLNVANAIEEATAPTATPEFGFNLNHWIKIDVRKEQLFLDRTGHSCGTVACIAGWTLLLNGHTADAVNRMADDCIVDTAAGLLGLGLLDAMSLFVPHGINLERAQTEKAVAVLRHLAETGKVDWSVAERVQ